MIPHILDHTALAAIGSRHMAQIMVEAAKEPGRPLLVPALCLAAAAAHRPGLGEFLLTLDKLQFLPLGGVEGYSLGELVRSGTDWAFAHAAFEARPKADSLEGRPICTVFPAEYRGMGVTTLKIVP
ncbi:hypothetical protein ABGB12_31475 [Actinocorallia sp. B10E7]|uniref:hypothetical protein n=1 Tax=Actinocorallia sp. B10E7 TaxID=3153558 RepID=UPI00325D62B0